MAIRFRLDPDPADAVGVALSPLCETALSLHVLIKPKYHPVQHPWIRAMRTLSPALKREVRAFAPFYVDAIPDAFLPAAESATFEEELAALEALPLETLAYELARPLFHYSHVAGGRTDLGIRSSASAVFPSPASTAPTAPRSPASCSTSRSSRAHVR